MPERFALILAGGRGERFWPWSRPERPKQLLPLARGGRSLLAATFDRALRVVDREHVLVMTAMDLCEACGRECPGATILGEPVARNTAPAIAAAAAGFIGEEHAFVVLPADHAVDDEAAFARDLTRAFEIAEEEAVLVTFGIRPNGPETNFGYIRRGAKLADRFYRVAQFTEKPDRARAEQWVAGGDHFWNSGIFVWRKRVFFEALEAGRPQIARKLRAIRGGSADAFSNSLREVFPSVESVSVDYAVLEGAPNTVVLEASFDWDDLGSWSAWARRQERDARGNVRHGDTVVEDCDGCVVVGDGGTAAAIGLRDMVVVHAGGATLSCRLEDSERVRKVSEALRERPRPC